VASVFSWDLELVGWRFIAVVTNSPSFRQNFSALPRVLRDLRANPVP
jgi:hypothetical protein